MSFDTLGLTPSLVKAIHHQNYTKPYPIQEKAIPAILKGKDILGIAKTGSGKTASYVLPILNSFHNKVTSKNRSVSVLIMVPTRELAMQVNDVFVDFRSALSEPVRTMAVYGGVSINPQMKALYGTQILIATPGRLLELVESNAVKLSEVETLVLDEADKMLNLGFQKEMEQIFKLLPNKRQNLLFSATLSDQIDTIHSVLLHEPEVIKIAEPENKLELINQVAYYVSDDRKGPLLRYLIKTENLQQVLVFTSSIYQADNVMHKLRKNGIDAQSIHGKKSQKSRKDALRNFKSGKLRVLVATDLLARGIDIEFLPCVINYELPRSPKDFVHRIGRTGRAESPGNAFTLVVPDDEHHFKVIQKKMKRRVDRVDASVYDLKGY